MQNQLVLMLKEPIEVICSNLDCEIGEPKDIHLLLEANGKVNFEQELPIPRPTNILSKNGTTAMIVDEVASKAGLSSAANGENNSNGKHIK